VLLESTHTCKIVKAPKEQEIRKRGEERRPEEKDASASTNARFL
jgi:hypothetical protein